LKKLLLVFLKIGISVAILAYLVYQAHANEVFPDLAAREKDWKLLAGAVAAYFAGLGITIVRWWYLVRALGIDFSLRESFRLGFLGFLFNLAPMGILGGDLLKAVMLGRHQPAHRAEALVTVFVDRVIGLYVLFLVASTAILATGIWRLEATSVQIACKAVWLLTAVGTVAVIVPLAPDLTRGKSTELAGQIPYIGRPLKKMILAVRTYRTQIPVLCGCALATVAVHSLFVLVLYWICAGLYSPSHTLATHFVVTPVSSATAVIPISLGPFEFVLDALYAAIPLPDGGRMAHGQGFVVALGYRVITVFIAAIGLFYYLGSRREVTEVMHEAEMDLAP
jgi:uncharacterized protein (TIRG00374 family)